jgi:putative addiction module component (TIGR02574 family)
MEPALRLPPAGFEQLSVEQQIDYVQALWDHIAANPEKVPVPDWHFAILEDRLAGLEANPGLGRPWEDVEADLISRSRPR